MSIKWDKVFKTGPSEICGRQPFKNLKGYGLLEADHTPSKSLKAVFRKLIVSTNSIEFFVLNAIIKGRGIY